MIDESRKPRAVFYVQTPHLVSLFTNGFRGADFVQFPLVKGLPETARAVTAFYDACRDAFGVIVEDDSFEQVPEGCRMPEIKVTWECAKVRTDNYSTLH